MPSIDGRLKLAILFLVPALVRAVVHLELSGDPYYDTLFVDARIYDAVARALLASQEMKAPHWQPPFFPQFLSVVYGALGTEPDRFRWVQILLGSSSCVLLFVLAKRLVTESAAWVAWGILALSGPAVFFDLQLLPASLATFLCLGAWVLTLDERLPWFIRAPGSGLLAGLASITVGNMLLLVVALCLWFLWGDSGRGRPIPRGTAAMRSAVCLATALIPILVVAWQNYQVSREFIPISYNGGINFWIGNNPDYDATTAIRPGRAWQALVQEPAIHGATGFREQSDYFFEKSRQWITDEPGKAVSLWLRKAGLLLRGDEIPRNQELYPYRESSYLLSVLLWSKGLAFPTGLLIPLAVAGWIGFFWGGQREPGQRQHGQQESGQHVSSRSHPGRTRSGTEDPGRDRRAWLLLKVFVLLYGLSIILFFVTSRYRAPLLPYLALFAGAGLTLFPLWWKQRRAPALAAATVFLVVLAVSNLPALAMPGRHSSDTVYDLGLAYQSQGRVADAQAQYEEALRIDPGNTEAHNNLGGLLASQGRFEEAAKHVRAVVERYPKDPRARHNLARIELQRGDPYEAGKWLEQLRREKPGDPNVDESWRRADAVATELDREQLEAIGADWIRQLRARLADDPENMFLRRRLARMESEIDPE